MTELVAKSLAAYLLGTLMGGTLIGVLRGVDLRASGSGNLGATNALRTQGKYFGLGVLLLDAGKGVLAALLLPALSWPFAGAAAATRESLGFVCGVAVALGHVFPVWHGFRGGKGVATLTGVFGALLPAVLPWVFAAFALTVLLSGYVSLASVLGALTALVCVVIQQGADSAAAAFTLAMAALVAVKHRENLVRLRAGREHRFERARLLGRALGLK